MQGHDGNDQLDGGKGNDKLDGDDGKNVFTGGKGKDVFVIDDDDDGFVTIKDFNGKKDKLEIDDDYEFLEDFKKKVVDGNMEIRLDGELVAQLNGVTELTSKMIIWE